MTTIHGHDQHAHPARSPATADGGITRLEAFDGLFLRAEHLRLIQDYARDLAYTIGAAGGAGVVEGFAVTTLDDGRLEIGPGLAIAPNGRPLRSAKIMHLERPTTRPDHTWYRVELLPDDQPYGAARVGTRLCEPCDDRQDTENGTATPYQDEGVRALLVADSENGKNGENGFDGWPSEQRRGLLAQLLFRREEEDREPPAWPGRAGSPTLPSDWEPPGPRTSPPGVHLAVLLPTDGSSWELDTWVVRRDRVASPPDDAWRRRLAMRPWSVYIAQILQFQAQYAGLAPTAGIEPAGPTFQEFVEGLLRAHGGEGPEVSLTSEEVAEVAAAAAAGPRRRAPFEGPLSTVMPELPPAGFLAAPRSVSEQETVATLLGLLGDGVGVSFALCRVGDVGLAIEQARHRHRIRLRRPTSGPRDELEILVPVEDTSSQVPTFQRTTDWVAFVHRDSTMRPERDLREIGWRPLDGGEGGGGEGGGGEGGGGEGGGGEGGGGEGGGGEGGGGEGGGGEGGGG